MVPLGWGLRVAGHDVLFATQPELVPALTSTGLPTIGVGRDHRLSELLLRTPKHRRAGKGLEDLYLRQDATWDELAWSHGYIVKWWFRLVNEPMLDELVQLCQRWRPDLVVWETTSYAGAVAANVVSASHYRFVWSLDLMGRMREQFLAARALQPQSERVDPMAAWLEQCARRHGGGFEEALVSGHATITYLPETLRAGDPTGLEYLPMRYVPYNGSTVIPEWVYDAVARPRVCVCLGSSAIARFGTYACSVPDLLAALSELDVDVVAMIDPAEHKRLGELPSNVRLESFVPLDALLPTCAVLVNHGGPGTVCTGVAHSVPQLMIPAEFDAPLLAEMVAKAGAGLVCRAEEAGVDSVRELVGRLLSDPAFRTRAGALRAEFDAMPDPYHLGERLGAEAARHRDHDAHLREQGESA